MKKVALMFALSFLVSTTAVFASTYGCKRMGTSMESTPDIRLSLVAKKAYVKHLDAYGKPNSNSAVGTYVKTNEAGEAEYKGFAGWAEQPELDAFDKTTLFVSKKVRSTGEGEITIVGVYEGTEFRTSYFCEMYD